MGANRAQVREKVEKMLAGVRAAGLKMTPQRMAIVRELASDETHPTAQEIFERLRPALRGGPVYTDDKAPVEWLVDTSIVHYAAGNEP